MSYQNNINSFWVATSTQSSPLLSYICAPPYFTQISPFSYEPAQKLWLYVSDEKTAMRISDELKEIINPIVSETDCCVNLTIENGTVRFWKSNWFVHFGGEWEISANVYNPEKCFDILGFVEENKNMISSFEAKGINKFKG